ncbi:molybdate ABC transporter substrate-binding protein [Aporhodopirellula aestuarii]|uniref:Molybdate ABC transporter substrate-binding protein n=1 Tax=Aporhodopirellula aestuarii TaxID=2950107 RepID=A0ABT0UCR5_9BACT|nr:molybdate ABC transporter substrate-binding protein [Aporhodopirellula aestuarii]MCM2374597.1 molybdate ABC transporter substrate-binding protein [Aporhodopirellula aestuarii]
MNRPLLLLLALVAALPFLLLQLSGTDDNAARRAKSAAPSDDDSWREPITVYCAASNQAVMETIIADYRHEFGSQVFVNYGPSQGLLAQIEVSHTGDLFLPADASYLESARDKQLVSDVFPVARMKAVIAIRRGNPKAIRTLADCLRGDVRFVQANPDAAAIGRLTRATLQRQGLWKSLDQATTAYRGNVTEVANDLAVGSADTGIVYDAVLHDYPGLEFIEIPELQDATSDVEIGIITESKRKASAMRFVEFLTANDRGRQRYREHGFEVPIDPTEETRSGSSGE